MINIRRPAKCHALSVILTHVKSDSRSHEHNRQTGRISRLAARSKEQSTEPHPQLLILTTLIIIVKNRYRKRRKIIIFHKKLP